MKVRPVASFNPVAALYLLLSLRAKFQCDNLERIMNLWRWRLRQTRIGNRLHGGTAKIRIATFSSNTDWHAVRRQRDTQCTALA
jgi:hypothetical protein